MDVSKAIRRRKSVRKDKADSVSKKHVDEIIEAARLAPSGNNAQPWRFVVVSDDKTKTLLKENNIFPQDFVYTSPTILVCCSDPKAYSKNLAGLDDDNKVRAVRDVSIASAFMVLRAEELGLSTCYVGWLKKEEIKPLLNIPKECVVPYILTLGYSDENPHETSRKDVSEILIKK